MAELIPITGDYGKRFPSAAQGVDMIDLRIMFESLAYSARTEQIVVDEFGVEAWAKLQELVTAGEAVMQYDGTLWLKPRPNEGRVTYL